MALNSEIFISFMNASLKKIKWKIKIAVYNQNILNLIEATKKHFVLNDNSNFLDIGCNDGVYTKYYCDNFGIDYENAYGIDYNEENVKKLPEDRFYYHDIDCLDPLPYKDKLFDLIIMNQVLEHTKNISHVFSDINRVSQKGAIFVLSVPNLAALHSRLCLLFGKMPLAIQGMDAHVRGFTINSLKKYASDYGFQYVDCTGSGLYPITGNFNRHLGRLFPQLSVFITLIFKKSHDYDISKLRTKHFHETKDSLRESPYLK